MAKPASPGFNDCYLTVREISEAFRVAKMTVHRMIDDGKLEYLRIGASYRIPERAVRATIGNPDESWLTVAEVAALLQVSKLAVYRMIERKELEIVSFSRAYRVLERAVREFIENGTVS